MEESMVMGAFPSRMKTNMKENGGEFFTLIFFAC